MKLFNHWKMDKLPEITIDELIARYSVLLLDASPGDDVWVLIDGAQVRGDSHWR